ncbi:hypothetical protein MSPP1_003991 [Malassezia sp. CBS 17886]|nr:hypothetical protein MSPP1_003991 [Malassezia sp. CBS 17886]
MAVLRVCAAPRHAFSSTVWVRAAEDPRMNLEKALPPGFEKLSGRPEALAAMQNLIDVLKKNGMDLSSGEKPSMMQLARMATNSEVRECTAKVVEEMRKAGIDLSPERLQELMKGSGFNK